MGAKYHIRIRGLDPLTADSICNNKKGNPIMFKTGIRDKLAPGIHLFEIPINKEIVRIMVPK